MGGSSSSTEVYDVIVVGAGPAGAAAACYLKLFDNRSLARVLLIEKHPDPATYDKYHHKCGEGVSESFLREISPIRVATEHIITRVSVAREHWGEGHVSESPTKECILDRPAFLRSVIDTFARNGGEVCRDEVLRLGSEGSLTRVECASGHKAIARVVIGADGPNSRLRGALSLPKPLILPVMQYLIPNESADDHTMTVWYGARFNGGYKYVFPYGPGKGKMGFIKGTAEYSGPSFELQAKQVAMGGMRSFTKGNVVLIGSAAAFTNPLTGGGIKVGFLSARELARCILKAIEGSREKDRSLPLQRAIKRFERWWKKSPYFSGSYMRAYERFKQMDDAGIERLGEPFYLAGKARRCLALLKNVSYWGIYKAFLDAAKYS